MDAVLAIAGRLVEIVITIMVWEWFGKDFITWDGFGTPFRRKNRTLDERKG